MAEGTVIQTNQGATLAVSATLPATYDAAGYGATAMVYTAVGQIENHGSHGGTKQIATFTPVDTGVVAKLAGSKDYGSKQLSIGWLPSDAGQDILAAAFESKARYSVKITYPLRDGESTPEIHYLDVIVSSFQNTDGAANDVRKLNVGLEICRAPVKVAAT